VRAKLRRLRRVGEMRRLYEDWPIALADRLRLLPPGREIMLSIRQGPRLVAVSGDEDVRVINEIWLEDVYRYGSLLQRPDPVVLDVGANRGYFSAAILSRYPAARVVCVEPAPANVALAERNLRQFGGRACLIPVAAVAQPSAEHVDLFLSRLPGRHTTVRGRVPDSQAIRVPARTLSDIVQEVLRDHGRLDLLKLDTEGTEPELLESLMDTHLLRIGAVAAELEGPGARDAPGRLLQAGFVVETDGRFVWAWRGGTGA